MIDKQLWSMRSASRRLDVDVARDEPSHIHIARPSRRLRRDIASTARVEPTDEIRDLTAVETTVQAA